MNGRDNTNFVHLNHDNRWPGFHLHKVEIAGAGELQLRAVPRLIGSPPGNLEEQALPNLPAGIVADGHGQIFLSDPKNHLIWRSRPCDEKEKLQIARCAGGEGYLAAQFQSPRGLHIDIMRNALFVADTRNHRVQIFDTNEMRLLEIWGDSGDAGEPQPGVFDQPFALTGDSEGNIYVLSTRGRLLQKFNRVSQREEAFWTAVASGSQLIEPVALTIQRTGVEEYVLVLDRGTHAAGLGRVIVFDRSGHPTRTIELENGNEPFALAASATALYIGDNGRRAVVKYDLDGTEAGPAVGFHGPVAAQTVEAKKNLLVHTGDPQVPLRLALAAGHLALGDFWTGPITVRLGEVEWHRLKARVSLLPDESHVQFYLTTDRATPGGDMTRIPQPGDSPEVIRTKLFSDEHQHSVDVADILIREPKAERLYLGAKLTGDGTGSPKVAQIRVSYNHETYIKHLPAIYRNEEVSNSFLVPALALFESFFEEVESNIRDLPRLIDPFATPSEFLPWLADSLGVEFDDSWSEELTRTTLAAALEAFARRGTTSGLRHSLTLYAQVRAHVIEPIRHLQIWSLGETSTLGYDTMLASAHPQGAVVGNSAILDQSHLISNEELGSPLFESVAHQFLVQVYRGEIRTAEKLEEVHRIIQREKPAHTAYHLCPIEPAMQIGLQSRVGIDTVVASTNQPARLGDRLHAQGALGSKPAGIIGESSQVGVSTRVY